MSPAGVRVRSHLQGHAQQHIHAQCMGGV